MSGSLDVVVYHYDDVKAPLLRDAVLPALEDLSDGVIAHLQRGWLHGPHLRVRLDGPTALVECAAEALVERLTRHVAAFPSTASLSRRQLLDRAGAAGRAELVPPPYEPFVANNTVRTEVPDPAVLARAPGWPATASTKARLLREGIPAIAATVAHTGACGDSPGSRVRATVVALAANADAWPLGIADGQMSYRSHLEHYLHHHDPGGATRARHAAVWARHAREICDLVSSVCGSSDAGPLADVWHRWSVAALQTAALAESAGTVHNASHGDLLRLATAFADPSVRHQYGDDVSDFHRAMVNRSLDAAEQRWFEVDRFRTNMLYQLLAVADVTPAERYLSASLVCAAVEKLTGTTVWELLEDQGKSSSEGTLRASGAVR